MRRFLLFAAVPALLFVLTIGLSGDLRAEDEKQTTFEDLDAGPQKDLCEKARAYFDPDVEFLWRPRREFLAAVQRIEESSGVDALKDLTFMREVIYQGRHFLTPYDDRKWLSAHGIDQKKKSGFYNLKSEEWRFTYTLPKKYPGKRDFQAIPRKTAPFPLLVCLHEVQDTRNQRGQANEFPGMSGLERRFPKSKFGALYDNWFTLAPVAARARFLEDDNAVRHLFLTAVVTEFWRHYHVDFDRIMIDGTEAAAALAAVFPNIFAGLVLRGGNIEADLVKNYAAVPVFVVNGAKAKDLVKTLKDAGHPDVTTGTDEDVVLWMNKQRRQVPASFEWRMTRDDHRYANWITLINGAPERSLKVETDRGNNTVKITAEGVEQIQVYLSDEIVDLDNEVTLVVNGKELKYREERSFGQLFDKDPFVRRSMNFGWLYPVLLTKIKVPDKPVEEQPSETDTTPPEEAGPTGSPEEEALAKKWFERGKKSLDEEDKVKARTWFTKCVEVGETSYKAQAQAQLDALK